MKENIKRVIPNNKYQSEKVLIGTFVLLLSTFSMCNLQIVDTIFCVQICGLNFIFKFKYENLHALNVYFNE